MKSFVKLPLYLGLGVFVFSVLLSAVKVGEERALISQRTKAGTEGASLSLNFSPPNTVSVLVSSDKQVSGVDVTLKLSTDKLTVLPSTLIGGPAFKTTGGILDEENMTFSFAALAKQSVTSGIVATFTIKGKDGLGGAKSMDANMTYVTSAGSTTVIDKTGQNIPGKTGGLNFSLTTR